MSPAVTASSSSTPGPKSGEEMDAERVKNMAYAYLCHLEEAKVWIEECIGEELPESTELEENLRNGVYLAKLASKFAPNVVPKNKIFDSELAKYRSVGLTFRHTDNINYFLQAVRHIGLPEVFSPETTDIYDAKNMPRVIFCIHALSLLLFRLGWAPKMQDLYGKATFTDEQICFVQQNLDAYDKPMPQFHNLDGAFAGELGSNRRNGSTNSQEEEYTSAANYEDVDDDEDDEEEERLNSSIRDAFYNNEECVINFQAHARGFLARQALYIRLKHYYENVDLVVRAQSAWRMILQRRKFRRMVEEAYRNRPRKPSFKPLAHYKRHEKDIVRIQRCWRQYKNKKDFEALMQSKEMNLAVVRKYLHLLDIRSEDFDQELELQSLKGQITKAIRQNRQLEKDLDSMDIKIGLLVKERISVQEVVAHSQTLSRKANQLVQRKETFYLGSAANKDGTLGKLGLKALKKESKEKLDAYQHLFYLLQTNPEYLAKLVFMMPQSKTNKFLESVILTLYNFGANPREEYLLLRLFKSALEEEVRSKVDKLCDIATGQPLVIKMIVSFNRSGRGQACLRDLLGPLVNRVLEDKNLRISTNPVEIYKQWVNQIEFESGKASGMPYDVTTEAALGFEEVRHRLERSITKLKQVATLFLTTILKSKNKLPYGILFMAKVLRKSLQEKFPSVPEKEILKTIGNLIYYRYINSAIVAPDSCDIIDSSADKALNNEQRKNLGSVAKVLQFAASKKGFGDESPHLICLNQYIVECHEKLKNFFRECCEVPDPEEHFSIDQFTEATVMGKPMIYISLAEICDTHQLLLDYRYQLASGERDPLHELLDDLKGSPSLCSLLGAADTNQSDASLSHLGQTEVCLTLSNKFDMPALEQFDTDRLFLKTKMLLATVLPCTKESNLLGCLKSRTTDDQAELYWQLVERQEEADKKAHHNRTMLDHTNLFADDDGRLPLDDCKRQILKNLKVLEHHGYVTSKDGCQAIVAALGRDIVNQKQYRTRRRKDIFRLRAALVSLEAKRRFYEEQVASYNEYLKGCLANLHAGDASGTGRKRKVRFHKTLSQTASTASSNVIHKKVLNMKTVKYTGTKLYEKGILLTIEGLPANQFKNVIFEFVPMDDGIFEVHARFMGVRLEHVEVDIQELLQLQYEGVTVMNLFGKARINVNLLLHFLNVKFYGRKK